MNPKTGEIKEFKDGFVPAGWIGLPRPGDEVEIICGPFKKRGRMWRVVKILQPTPLDGTPGKLVLEPTVDTINKAASE